MSRLDNDPIARMIAQAVQHYVTTSPDLSPLPSLTVRGARWRARCGS